MLQLSVTRLVASSVLLFGVVLVSPRCLHLRVVWQTRFPL